MTKDFIIFVKNDCPECSKLKKMIDITDYEIVYVDNPRGMALASYYECISETMPYAIHKNTNHRANASADNVYNFLTNKEYSTNLQYISCDGNNCRII